MAINLHKSFLGISQVLVPEESDDEPDPEDKTPMPPGGQLATSGSHMQAAVPTLAAHFSLNALEHNTSSLEANGVHASTSVAANTPVDLPLAEDGQLQRSSTRGSATIPANRPAPGTGVQSMPSNSTASSQEANTVASQDHVGNPSEQFVPPSRLQESDSESGGSPH
ncbi:hypothetical protein FRC11_007480 [Ceratobasidium sp. 423]|nr:hypothetical protein FRC11_007480 [Ceratobasidium sp. 423]